MLKCLSLSISTDEIDMLKDEAKRLGEHSMGRYWLFVYEVLDEGGLEELEKLNPPKDSNQKRQSNTDIWREMKEANITFIKRTEDWKQSAQDNQKKLFPGQDEDLQQD